jgi:hypothetical protein
VTNGEQLRTAVSGSFKFKPEIDLLHEEFADHGVKVLEPSKGWLWTPSLAYEEPGEIRPLPIERSLTAEEIEERFLRALDDSDFHYVNNLEGYIGDMTAYEIDYSIEANMPIYSREPIDFLRLAKGDLRKKELLEARIIVASIADIVDVERARRDLEAI